MIYKKLPIIKAGSYCILCKGDLKKKNCRISVYKKELEKDIAEELLFCDHCGIPYATSEVFTNIRHKNDGFVAEGYMFSKKSNVENIIKGLCTPPKNLRKERQRGKTLLQKQENFLKRHATRQKEHNYSIYAVNCEHDFCPICHRELKKNYPIEIPVNETESIAFHVSTCGKHYISKNIYELKHILNKNVFARDVQLISTYFFQNYKTAQEIYKSKDSHSVMFLLKKTGETSENELVIIFGNYSQTINNNIRIINYKDNFSRELLTQYFKFGCSKWTIEETDYEIIHVIKDNDEKELYLQEVVIKEDGGFSKSVKNSNYELVDALMFSAYTNRFEIVKATYHKPHNQYFMDICFYRKFIKEFGNPKVPLLYQSTYNNDYNTLRDESLLHAYGYNVNQKDNLSSNERRNILSEIIDLELMDQKAIVKLLKSCMSRQKNNAVACTKWEADIDFVMGYKANPQRFIIANKTKKY